MKTTNNNLIFLVDDNELFLKSMESYVKQNFKGFAITTFTTGEECLKCLSQNPGIILLDYMLNTKYPNAMNGIKVLEQIKKTNPEVAVIMFSAQDHIEVAVDTMKHGAFDYIIKNDRMFLRVQNAIKNVLHTHSLKMDLQSYKRRMIGVGVVATLISGTIIYMSIFCRNLLN